MKWKKCSRCGNKIRVIQRKCKRCGKLFDLRGYYWQIFCNKKCQKKYWDKFIKYSPKWLEVPFKDKGFLINTYHEMTHKR